MPVYRVFLIKNKDRRSGRTSRIYFVASFAERKPQKKNGARTTVPAIGFVRIIIIIIIAVAENDDQARARRSDT